MTNRERFDEFIVKYLDDAHKLAEIYVKNREDAEDVVSESIVKALRNIHEIKNNDLLMKRWFNKIIINVAINHLRRQSKRDAMSETVPHYYFDDFSLLELEDLLDTLAPEDRKIVSLRFCDQYEIKEIAQTLGMNENTVKTRLYRALKKLKLQIIEDENVVTVNKDKSRIKTSSGVVITVLLCSICIFNLFPTLAAAAYDIPVLGDIVRVITFNRFEYKEGGHEAEIIVPEIQGLLDQELQDRLNAEFRENADDLIRSFEQSVIEEEEFGVEAARMSIKADYAVRTDNDRVLSLDTYIYSDISGYVLHKFYTLDKAKERRIELKDLFKTDADYVAPISEYIVAEMIRLNAEEGGVYFVEGSEFQGNHFTTIRPDQHFYINDEGKLVICFDKHGVGAGFMGSPEFIIPQEIIKDISDSDLIM